MGEKDPRGQGRHSGPVEGLHDDMSVPAPHVQDTHELCPRTGWNVPGEQGAQESREALRMVPTEHSWHTVSFLPLHGTAVSLPAPHARQSMHVGLCRELQAPERIFPLGHDSMHGTHDALGEGLKEPEGHPRHTRSLVGDGATASYWPAPHTCAAEHTAMPGDGLNVS
jgi:hypothetical protein